MARRALRDSRTAGVICIEMARHYAQYPASCFPEFKSANFRTGARRVLRRGARPLWAARRIAYVRTYGTKFARPVIIAARAAIVTRVRNSYGYGFRRALRDDRRFD